MRWDHIALTVWLRFGRMKALAAIAAFPAAAGTSGFCFAPLSRARLGLLPRDDRWHRAATPMLGGIGIFAGI